MESLITLVLFILVVGLLLYALRLALGVWPGSEPIRTIIEVVVILIIIVYLLRWIAPGVLTFPFVRFWVWG